MRKRCEDLIHIIREPIYIGAQLTQNMQLIQISACFLACVCVITSFINLKKQSYPMMATTLLLALSFSAIAFLSHYEKNRRFICNFIVILLEIILTYYIIVGGNDGVGTLWIFILPIGSMAVLGVSYGLFLSGYFLGLLILLFWTPLRQFISPVYNDSFLARLPILFFCSSILSFITNIELKKFRIIKEIEAKKLEALLQTEREKVSKNTIQTIAAIASAQEAKDADTYRHSQRVAQYSCAIAEKMGWDSGRVDNLRSVALLHDIGKIGVPDSVLQKPEKLTPAEYDLMKQHTLIGNSILSNLEFPAHASVGAWYHHERYDGTGYPCGLKGNDIPIEARIISVADAADAMHAARIYCEQQPTTYVQQELVCGSGTQFDPVIVDAMLELIQTNHIIF
ncbi:MAG: HD domain-containing phosphohydrolase [Lachnospiraceae bacterium]